MQCYHLINGINEMTSSPWPLQTILVCKTCTNDKLQFLNEGQQLLPRHQEIYS